MTGSAALPARRALRIAGTWAIGLGILGLLLVRSEVQATLRALEACDAPRYFAIAFGFVCFWLALDAAILARVFSRLVAPISWWSMVTLRARTYPAMTLSYDLANAALIAAVARATRSPLTRTAGAVLVHYLADLAALFGLAFAASWFSDADVIVVLRPWLGGICALMLGGLFIGRAGRGWLHGRRVVEALGELATHELGLLVAARAGFVASFALFAWATLPTFGLHVPLLDALARMPLVMSVAALPITPGGLGTAQAAIAVLFHGLGSDASLLGWGLLYGLTLLGLRLPLGLAFWLMPSAEVRIAPEGCS